MKNTIVKHKVQELLRKYPVLRDNDEKLINQVQGQELVDLTGKGVERISAAYFFKMRADGKISKPETIRRTRQKLQEEDANLRGEKWLENQTHN